MAKKPAFVQGQSSAESYKDKIQSYQLVFIYILIKLFRTSPDFTCLLQRWKIELQENKQILKMA